MKQNPGQVGKGQISSATTYSATKLPDLILPMPGNDDAVFLKFAKADFVVINVSGKWLLLAYSSHLHQFQAY
ncbi:MAG: hypothetical protein P4L53_12395 [Candidatus Obscuribacterales bacterium]|nr:hypothetical protein [Candidatus Obscuribacterales bacterium]